MMSEQDEKQPIILHFKGTDEKDQFILKFIDTVLSPEERGILKPISSTLELIRKEEHHKNKDASLALDKLSTIEGYHQVNNSFDVAEKPENNFIFNDYTTEEIILQKLTASHEHYFNNPLELLQYKDRALNIFKKYQNFKEQALYNPAFSHILTSYKQQTLQH